MIRKGPVPWVTGNGVRRKIQFVDKLLGLAA